MAPGSKRVPSNLTKSEIKELIKNAIVENSITPSSRDIFIQLQQQIIQLQQQLDELITLEILPIDPNFNLTQSIEHINFAQIKSLITDERTAILEWHLQDDNFQTFIITAQSDLPLVIQASVKDNLALVELIQEYFQDYQKNQEQWRVEFLLRLNKLAQILHLDEILNNLPTTCDQLILIPHRFLHCLPLHALPFADGSCLLDRFPEGIRYVPSCRIVQMIQSRQRTEFSNFFAIQNPNGNLPYTNVEVENIKRYFPNTNILTKADARKDLLNNQTLNSVHCLHFSGDSDFKIDSPLESCLFFADEPVTLEEIFKLNLSKCRLVTLSASETALIDWTNSSDEYIGFPGAFLCAGSTSVVGSLWGVNDLSTALLMIKFYQNLQMKTTIAVALNQAQIWLRDITKKELLQWIDANQIPLNATIKMILRRGLHKFPDDIQPFHNPLYWAAFCAIGQ
ncbi:CHAT domain-containing protein [Okeanomitos corallinicola TIOX110]|uniref:CHAT domain-containing protein n=1 Tax=Okeanomitos corallinicola TIOX110 TaxID=3133117 RepID=A0ABZ2UV93_9CYAN